MNRRRRGLSAVAACCFVSLCWKSSADAQSTRVFKLGVLLASAPFESDQAARVPMELRQMGYVEGGNLLVERRYADRRVERLPALARELVAWHADVIMAVGTSAVHAARDATATIPIVMVINVDPVADGLVGSLARPGGNITGVLITAEGTLAGKRLELIKEAVPRATRIGFLAPDDPAIAAQVDEARKAALALGVTLVVVVVSERDYDRAFARLAREKAEALFVAATPIFGRDRHRILELAAKHRLPAMWEWREQVQDGGLMTYGSSLSNTYRRAAEYVVRIFRGAAPGDLPIEQPTKFELVINAKTAKVLGLAIPQSLYMRADEVIQ